LQKTKGHYPAPLAALEVIKKTYNLGNKSAGFKIEAQEFSKLAASSICKNLIELFFTGEEIKKDSGIANDVLEKEIKKAGVLGAGVMGGGIAWLFSNYDISVRMKDIAQNAIALGFNQVLKIYQQLMKIKKYTESEVSLKMNNVTSDINYIGFKDADIVVEAIVENMEIKKKSLAELENYVNENTIIASNTSSLSITEMGSVLKHPQRFAGMHFFNPVNRMPLVEVIRGEKTSDQTVASIVKLSKKMGKTPIVVQDVAGFLVNRILIPYINEAGFLLEEGADLKRIDKLVENFGMPMGPFILADTVGIDVGYKVIKILHEAYGERMKSCAVLEEISHNKELLGKKSSLGFYKYDKEGKNIGINPQINSIINKIATENNLKKFHFTDQEIIDRCFLIIINEASKCLEENVVKNARYLDMAMIMGSGFPAFRGGLLRYADEYGIKNVVKRLTEFKEKYSVRFSPSELLKQMAEKNQNFY
jgi:3-hydroxyacyl-CoA dehydrogenase/enoyl-CoA hydratase/3-hydroxybutyryl-CoA epimerase